MIRNLIMDIGLFLRMNEHKHGYPMRLNSIVAFIEWLTDSIILTKAEGKAFGFI